MKIAVYIVGISVSFLLFGCSGKVQTNPLPDVKKYHFPSQNNETQLNTTLNEYGVLWDEYLREFFNKKNPNISKSIWQIGLERRHYEH